MESVPKNNKKRKLDRSEDKVEEWSLEKKSTPVAAVKKTRDSKKEKMVHANIDDLRIFPVVIVDLIIKYWRQFRLKGEFVQEIQLPLGSNPWDISSDSKYLYITETATSSLYLCSLTNNYSFHNYIVPTALAEEKIWEWDPISIQLLNNNLFILQSHTFTILDMKENKRIEAWDLPYGEGLYLTVDSKHIYFTVSNSNQIFVYSYNGVEVDRYGKEDDEDDDYTEEPGQFYEPTGLAVDSFNLYVCDAGHHRIQVLNKKTGGFKRKWGDSGTCPAELLDTPTTILIYDQLLYVADEGTIYMYTKFGNNIDYIIKDCNKGGLAIVNNRLYLSNRETGRIEVYK